MLVSLQSLIQRWGDSSHQLQAFLDSFSCSQDRDIRWFLRKRAVAFEKVSKSRTYFICDEAQFSSGDLGQVVINGYFTISLKILKIPSDLTDEERQDLDGISATIRGQQISEIPCFLIGQLARNSKIPKERLSGHDLLEFAYNVIADAASSVGGRIILVECHDEDKLVKFYEQNGFHEIECIADRDIPMRQLICKII